MTIVTVQDIDADEDILEVYGKLSVTVKLAIMKITGEGEVTYNKEAFNNDTYIKIKVSRTRCQME